MEIILLEKIRNLGGIGDKVKVKAGYWRNYLLPKGKAIMATAKNLVKLESMKAELETKAQDAFTSAQGRATKMAQLMLEIPAKVSEEGKLFGSVNIREIVLAAEKAGIELHKNEVSMPQGPIRQIGEYDIHVHLHTDVNTVIKVKVIPTEE
jgi:large subunit ribosomal protein L9